MVSKSYWWHIHIPRGASSHCECPWSLIDPSFVWRISPPQGCLEYFVFPTWIASISFERNSLVGEHVPDPHPPVTMPRMLLSPWGFRLELDTLRNVPSAPFIIIHGLRWHWWCLYHFYRHISNICPLWNVSIVKTWHFFVMNSFIMFAKAVIKCVPFYDNGVIEGGCNKSCLGLFFSSGKCRNG